MTSVKNGKAGSPSRNLVSRYSLQSGSWRSDDKKMQNLHTTDNNHQTQADSKEGISESRPKGRGRRDREEPNRGGLGGARGTQKAAISGARGASGYHSHQNTLSSTLSIDRHFMTKSSIAGNMVSSLSDFRLGPRCHVVHLILIN